MSVSCLVISTISSRRASVCVSVCVCVCVCVYVRACAHALAQSCLTLSNPRECSPQAPLSMKFSRQEYWSVLLFPIPRDLPKSGPRPASPRRSAHPHLLPRHVCTPRRAVSTLLWHQQLPDHLTCLLRNLYAVQEATVRTGHGTTDCPNTKRSTSRLYIATLLI